MKKLVEIEVDGVNYPLRASMRANREIAERFGTVEDCIYKMGEMKQADQISTIIWVLALFMKQAALYLDAHEKPFVEPPNAEKLEILMDGMDLTEMYTKMTQTITQGADREIPIEPVETGENDGEIKKNKTLPG